MSDYEKRGKAWYEAHREEKLAEEKDKRRWLSYYERNRDVVKERNRVRYYQRRGLEAPPLKTPLVIPPVDAVHIERLETLVGELRELIPHVMRPRRVRKAVPEAAAIEATVAAAVATVAAVNEIIEN